MEEEKTAETEKPTAQVYRLVKVDGGSRVAFKKFIGTNPNQSSNQPADAVASNAMQPEDEYHSLYIGAANDAGVLEPPYNLRRLDRLSQENNTLSPCIEAMVTNIEGTGYDFGKKDDEGAEDGKDDSKIDQLRDFFEQPWPGVSFVTMRKELRRDLESVGNAYIEVIRNSQDEIVFLRRVDAKMMRLLKLDAPVPVKKKVMRLGKEVEVTVMVRERRYCQLLNGITLIYFKEFGASRDLNKNTGEWAPKNTRLGAKIRASEIIHLTALPDADTPYGVPRWISQLPSVLGSRKAEEFNMDFFDNGGIPPVLITLQGGTLQKETRKALEQKMNGGAAALNRVQILEVEPKGGSIDHPTQARVTVERFGGDRTNDSMFEGYDDKCEKRIRRAFRLAPIFLGNADDYTFASAYVSYTVTEAQVFKPERDEFDEIISMRLLPAMGFAEYEIQSKPLVIEDVNLKLEGIQIGLGTNRVDLEDAIYELNEATGLNLKISEEPVNAPGQIGSIDADGNFIPDPPKSQHELAAEEEVRRQLKKPSPTTNGFGSTTSNSERGVQTTKSEGVIALAVDTLASLRKRDFVELNKNLKLIGGLNGRQMDELRKVAAELQFVNPHLDTEGLAELAGCTIQVMSKNCGHQH